MTMISPDQPPSPGHGTEWLPDAVSIGTLATWFPGELVDAVIDEADVRERRHRTLPARLMVYYVLALAMLGGKGYVEVMSRLTDGLHWLCDGQWRWETATVPAIAKARSRLGEAPLALLFNRVAGPVATAGSGAAFWRELRVVSVDELIVDLPDTPENTAFFGSREAAGPGGPAARLVAIGEAGTGALLGAAFGPAEHPGALLASGLVRQLDKTSVLVADQGLAAGPLWPAAVASGAELLWQVAAPAAPPPGTEVLADGTCLVGLPDVLAVPAGPAATDRRNALARMIECEVAAPDGHPPGPAFALLTTLTDPAEAPAEDLVAAYAGRWQARSITSSLLTRQHGRITLRSRRPDMVRQEMWATLCVYQRLRILKWHSSRALGLHEAQPPAPRAIRIRRR